MNFLPRTTLPRVTLVLIALLLSACLGQEDPPADAPANVTVVEGSGLVVVDWDTVPDRTYWIFYNQGTSTSLSDYDRILVGISPPYILTGLSNDTEYAFAVTSSKDGSKVGPFSPAISATPRSISPLVAWSPTSDPELIANTNALRSIALGSNTFVTVGDAATVFSAQYYYPGAGGVDATGWGAATLPGGFSANLSSVVYDGSVFVALGEDGSIIKSTDAEAQTWEAATDIAGASTMNAMAIGAGLTVAVGDAGEIYTSSDSAETAWTTQTSGTIYNLYGISYLNGNFIAVGASGTVLTSTDAVNWTSQTPVTGSSLRSVAYGASTYVAVGDAGAVVSSDDATTWSAQTTPTTESFHAISFGPDLQFVAVGTTGLIAYSTTGADSTWTTSSAGVIDLNAISPSLPPTPLYIATGAAGANVSGK